MGDEVTIAQHRRSMIALTRSIPNQPKAPFGSSSGGAIGSALHSLDVDLLCYCESVVHLHP